MPQNQTERPPTAGLGPPSAGLTLDGRYRLERLLARGGMGEVWAAVDVSRGGHFAIKIAREAPTQQVELRRRLLREAKAASSISHPNVLEVLDVFELPDGKPAMVTPLLEGETLGALLAREGSLSVHQTLELMLPVVDAIVAAHRAGIVHRDIKPDNIFLQRQGELKVLDFGIAKLRPTRDVNESSITGTGNWLGTPSYMAPEQAFGDAPIDERVDAWAIGVILYECLAGLRPIEGENQQQVLRNLLTQGIMPLHLVRPDVPRGMSELVMRLLAREPHKRCGGLVEVRDLLVAFTASSSAPTVPL
ncbi:MAG: serine/threonine-protein kinase [Myxococcales bacterium]